ncbi:MAG: nucleoside hydrolase [Novosphingobium sp.]
MQYKTSRRDLLVGGIALGAAGALPALASSANVTGNAGVIVDNDFGGDPDGLFLLAHLLMCPSIAVPLVIGTHYKDFGAADRVPDKGLVSAKKASELLRFFPKGNRPPVIAGTGQPVGSGPAGRESPASAAIIREALRSDRSGPLYYAAGGSLTEIALAWLAEPKIGKRLKLVWIGGNEYPDLAKPPPGPGETEYNFSLDRAAAQVVFNQSDIEIWQIPRNAFRQMLIGLAELEELAKANPLGRYLHSEVAQTEQRLAQNLPGFIFTAGETYTLGDTALVTLTALQSAFQPDTASSSYVLRPTPILAADGGYGANPSGRPMRVYTSIDANLTWRDFAAKLRRFNSRR